MLGFFNWYERDSTWERQAFGTVQAYSYILHNTRFFSILIVVFQNTHYRLGLLIALFNWFTKY
jgi:hypothetical protein